MRETGCSAVKYQKPWACGAALLPKLPASHRYIVNKLTARYLYLTPIQYQEFVHRKKHILSDVPRELEQHTESTSKHWLQICLSVQLLNEFLASSLHACDLSMALYTCTGQVHILLLTLTARFAGPKCQCRFPSFPYAAQHMLCQACCFVMMRPAHSISLVPLVSLVPNLKVLSFPLRGFFCL